MKLYIVATPIGNLEDMTIRAITTLKQVDFILCEDTRVTRKLLDKFKLKHKPVISFHQHSKGDKYRLVERYLKDGMNLAFVSDAGTPGINDPGGKLIEHIVKKLPNVQIVPVPGASALSASLSISGFPLSQFTFLGFMPHKKGKSKMMKQMAESKYESIFFESTHRIIKTLEKLEEFIDDRPVMVCRELTKMFESVYRGSIKEILSQLKQDKIKGEFVVVVGPRR